MRLSFLMYLEILINNLCFCRYYIVIHTNIAYADYTFHEYSSLYSSNNM